MTVPPAVGALTGHRSEDLARWLRELHKVASLTGQAALDALDSFLWAYGEWADSAGARDAVPLGAQDATEGPSDAAWAAWQCAEDISRLRETITRLRRQQAAGQVDPWEPATLRRQSANIGHLAGQPARQTMADDIQAVQAEAEALAVELDIGAQRQQIATHGQKLIVNAGSIAGIVGAVDRAVNELRRLGALTPDDDAAANAAKIRAAKFRSQRKIEESEVAAAGGRLQVAERLRREAGALLRIDMAKAFPEGTLP